MRKQRLLWLSQLFLSLASVVKRKLNKTTN